MDADIEEKVNCCYTCQSSRTSCKGTTTSLGMAQGTLALDQRGLCQLQWQKSAHSHWCSLKMDRGVTNSTTTIEKLRCCFPMHCLPNLFVSDNGPCFTNLEFAEFTRKNDIKHKLVSHQMARLKVQLNLLSGLRRMLGTLETKLSWFLLSYRTTPYTTTGITPAELLMKRKLQTNLDWLRSSTSTTVLLRQDH